MNQIKINEKVLNFEVKESTIARHVRLEISPDSLRLVVPFGMNNINEINKYLHKYNSWINRKLKKFENIKQVSAKTFNAEEIGNSKNRIYGLVRKYKESNGLKLNKIYFRVQKTKLGSCSSSGNISFNINLMNYPLHVQEYVVVHELAHLKYKNPSREFKKYVSLMYPETNKALTWLKNNRVNNV